MNEIKSLLKYHILRYMFQHQDVQMFGRKLILLLYDYIHFS